MIKLKFLGISLLLNTFLVFSGEHFSISVEHEQEAEERDQILENRFLIKNNILPVEIKKYLKCQKNIFEIYKLGVKLKQGKRQIAEGNPKRNMGLAVTCFEYIIDKFDDSSNLKTQGVVKKAYYELGTCTRTKKWCEKSNKFIEIINAPLYTYNLSDYQMGMLFKKGRGLIYTNNKLKSLIKALRCFRAITNTYIHTGTFRDKMSKDIVRDSFYQSGLILYRYGKMEAAKEIFRTAIKFMNCDKSKKFIEGSRAYGKESVKFFLAMQKLPEVLENKTLSEIYDLGEKYLNSESLNFNEGFNEDLAFGIGYLQFIIEKGTYYKKDLSKEERSIVGKAHYKFFDCYLKYNTTPDGISTNINLLISGMTFDSEECKNTLLGMDKNKLITPEVESLLSPSLVVFFKKYIRKDR